MEILRPPIEWSGANTAEEERTASEFRWFAGFFDVGISAHISVYLDRQIHGGRVYEYQRSRPSLSREEWKFPARAKALERFGGKTYKEARENKFEGGEGVYWTWVANNYEACDIVRMVEPLLRLKKEVASFFLQWEPVQDRKARVLIGEEYQRFARNLKRHDQEIDLSHGLAAEYMAGLFDSCGSMWVESDTARVAMSLPNARLAEFIQSKYGGSYWEETGGKFPHPDNPRFTWRASGSTGIAFVKTMVPHLWFQRELVENLILNA